MTEVAVSENVSKLLDEDVKFPLAELYEGNVKVLAIKDGIELGNTLSIINLGNEAQSEISEFVSNELAGTKAESVTTENMENLGLVIDDIKSVNVKNVQNAGFLASLPIIGDRIAYTFDKVSMKFDTVNERVERIVDGIKGEMLVVDSSVETLDVLDGKYRTLIDNFEHYIAAGEAKIQEELKITYPVLKAKAEESGDVRDIEEFNAFQSQLVRLNQRVANMMISRQVAIESLPVIRALQSNFLQFKEEFTEVINTVIPMWKRQFLLAIEQNKQGKMLKISKSVKDYSNKQYIDFKEQMYSLEKDIGTTLSRGIIDPETLQRATDLTCMTIEEHKKRLEMTYNTQEKTKSVIRESQEKLQATLLSEVI